jgi:hypothetical protein
MAPQVHGAGSIMPVEATRAQGCDKGMHHKLWKYCYEVRRELYASVIKPALSQGHA